MTARDCMNHFDVLILDYGVGNLFNVQRAFEFLNAKAIISSNPADMERAPRLMLPGVGAFGEGMSRLKQMKGIKPLLDYAKSGRPILGVCLGMQILMSESEEYGCHQGLNIIPGRVIRFKNPDPEGLRYKIPHMGWNFLQPTHGSENSWDGTVLEDIGQNPYMYFVHSYMVLPEKKEDWLAESEYGKDKFCSVVKKGRITGCQFHPERSGPTGLQILKNFLMER